ncbi:MAG: tripeptidyl peptidase II, partial [Verrucomicrobiota bacterium]
TRLVRENEVIFVASAGNGGPALNTVGAPGGSTSAILGVGAWLSPAMMKTEYGFLDPGEGVPYTWSSRGPTRDGAWGVNFVAPGGAESPVPGWTLTRSMQAHGTSMASPNATGCIALLLSALKAEKIPYQPHTIRRALENTAVPQGEWPAVDQGHGLLQVEQAYDYLKNHQKVASIPEIRARVNQNGKEGRGVVLEGARAEEESTLRVSIRPVFQENQSRQVLAAFQQRLVLKTSESWLEVPESLFLPNQRRSIDVRIDPSALPPGLHTAEVCGFSAESEAAGPLFRLPVIVKRPIPLDEDFKASSRLYLESGKVVRQFFEVPRGAQEVEVHVKGFGVDSSRRIELHGQQVEPGRSVQVTGRRQSVRLSPEVNESERIFKVIPGRVFELATVQSWSSPGSTEVEMTVEFRGVEMNPSALLLTPGDLFEPVTLQGTVQPVDLKIKAELTKVREFLVAESHEIRILSAERDRLDSGRQAWEMILTYRFTMDTDGRVAPRFPDLEMRLYESDFQSRLWMVLDSEKKRVAFDDGWPGEISLKKGRHTLLLHFRHDDREALSKFAGRLRLALDRSLKKPVSLQAFASGEAAISGGRSFADGQLKVGDQRTLFLRSPAPLVGKGHHPGEILMGSLSVGAGSSIPVHYVVGPASPAKPSKAKAGAKKEEKEKETPLTKVRKAVAAFKVKQ